MSNRKRRDREDFGRDGRPETKSETRGAKKDEVVAPEDETGTEARRTKSRARTEACRTKSQARTEARRTKSQARAQGTGDDNDAFTAAVIDFLDRIPHATNQSQRP